MKKEETIDSQNQINFSLLDPVLEDFCEKICAQPKVRFCGIVNSMGRLIAGGLREGIEPLENEDQRQMLYIQSFLEMSMKRDFDETLGKVEYMATYRDNIAVITMPLRQNCLLLLSTEKNAQIKQIIQVATNLFECISLNHEGIPNTTSVISPEFA